MSQTVFDSSNYFMLIIYKRTSHILYFNAHRKKIAVAKIKSRDVLYSTGWIVFGSDPGSLVAIARCFPQMCTYDNGFKPQAIPTGSISNSNTKLN